MKKYVLYVFIVCICICTCSFGMDRNEYFSISLPNGYTMTQDEIAFTGAKYSYKIINSDNAINNIIIGITENSGKLKNSDLKTSDLDDIIEGLKEGYEEMGLSVTTSQKEIKVFSKNNYRGAYIKIHVKAYGLYQKLYLTCSENYVYMICTTYTEEAEKEFDSIVDSFTIRDTMYADIKADDSSDTQLFSDRFWARILTLLIIVSISYGIGKIKNKDKIEKE